MSNTFFRLHHNDRQMLTALLLIATVILGLMLFFEDADITTSEPQGMLAADSTRHAEKDVKRTDRGNYDKDSETLHERFTFDPNTATASELLRLGLPNGMVRGIIKYRSKGGRYMQKEDFARVPGLSLKDYHELEPYITIAADFQQASLYVKSAKKDTLHHAIPQKLKEGETIDLANADTAMLKRVPGIGSHFARKIAEHRQRLGGFVSVDQLDDIEMFPTEAKRYFTLTAGNNIKRININQMSLKELRQHPYLNYYQARTITEMRRKNGPLKSLDELRLSPYFPDEVRQRLAPYVEF